MNDHKNAALIVVETLRGEGFKALWAGGCVRDMLLCREPKDYDVATDALPNDVVRLFRRTITVGAQFGVVIVMMGEIAIEVATFRSDEDYHDGRRPNHVSFTDAKTDALRRDFTINGMFYDPVAREVIDYVDGRADLGRKLIRTIGAAVQRFDEDYLRMLRAVRFAAQLDFIIDDETWEAICLNAEKICMISGERIATELEKIFSCESKSKGMMLFVESGLAKAVFCEADISKFNYGIKVLNSIRGGVGQACGLASFMAGLGCQKALDLCRCLKLSNKQYGSIKWLLDNLGELTRESLGLATLKMLVFNEDFGDLVNIQRAVLSVEGIDLCAFEKNLDRAGQLKGKELLPKPFLNGNDIMNAGVRPGPELGAIVNELYQLQLEELIQTKQQAIEWLNERIKS